MLFFSYFYPESHQLGSSCSIAMFLLNFYLGVYFLMSVSLVALLYFKFVAIAQGRLLNGRKKKKTVLSLIWVRSTSIAPHYIYYF